MTTRRASNSRLRLTAASSPAARTHIQPTPEQRAAAERFLRREQVEGAVGAALAVAVAGFDETQGMYVDAARRQGEGTRMWKTAAWIVANAIAREAAENPPG